MGDFRFLPQRRWAAEKELIYKSSDPVKFIVGEEYLVLGDINTNSPSTVIQPGIPGPSILLLHFRPPAIQVSLPQMTPLQESDILLL